MLESFSLKQAQPRRQQYRGKREALGRPPGAGAQTLTQKALEVLGAAVLRPVGVLQVPDGPLLPAEQVLHLQARGGVAAGVRAEARGDLEPPVGHAVVPRAEARPVPEALLPSALLSERALRNAAGPARTPLHRSRLETRTATRPFSKAGTQAPSSLSGAGREQTKGEGGPHRLRSHHGYDRDPLFPHHLPEVRAGVLQWSLSGNIVPFDSTDRDLKLEMGFKK